MGKSYKNDTIDKDIGMQIGRLRVDLGESQEDLAKAIGVSREIVQHWERGSRMIKAGHLVALAKHFGVTADHILGIPPHREQSDAMKNLSAAEYTGLSVRAISKLAEWNESKGGQWLSGVMDEIILSDRITDYLTSLFSLAGTTRAMESDCDSVEAGTFSKTDRFESCAGAFTDDYNTMRRTRFQVSEALDDLIEDLYSYRAIVKRYEPLFSKLVASEISEDTMIEALKDWNR